MGWFNKKKKDDEAFGDDDLLPPLPDMDDSADLGESADTNLPPLPKPSTPTMGFPPMQSIPPSPMRAVRPSISKQANVFVRLDKYRDILHTIEEMQSKINELNKTITDISNIKNKETEIMAGWTALLSDAKAKVDEVNAKLAKPGEY